MPKARKGNTAVAKRLADAAMEVGAKPRPEAEDLVFLAYQFICVTLPHSEPDPNLPVWTRVNGNLTLSVRPGWDFEANKPRGYPFGTIPRLLLFWLSTEVVRNKSRTVYLGDSLADFMKKLGLDPSRGGVRSDVRRLREQMERLFRCMISLELRGKQAQDSGVQWVDMPVALRGELWWNEKTPNVPTLWKSWIELNPRLFDALLASSVPIDFRILSALKNSALGLDLYSWFSYKMFVVNKKNESIFVDWKGLMYQLGSQYSNWKDFKKNAKLIFEKIKIVSPEFPVEFVDRGLVLKPSDFYKKSLEAIQAKTKKRRREPLHGSEAHAESLPEDR